MGYMIGGYEVLEKIGSGAVGEVFKGRDVKANKIVAIKILSEDLSNNPNAVERFKREIRQAIQLDHPNLVAAYTGGEFKGRRYYAMEFVEGFTVEKLLLREGALDDLSALDIVVQVAKAMEYANGFNIVHRDIKPDNIIVTPEKKAKLCDMGLAKASESQTRLTALGTVLGTPHYMSPEQARGDDNIDTRTDIFSLGATWYRMVTGSPPFEGPDPISILTALIEKDPTPVKERNPKVADGVGVVIQKMMAKDRDKRYRNFTELLEVLGKLKAEVVNNQANNVGQRKRPPAFVDCICPSETDVLVGQIAIHNKLVTAQKLEESLNRQELLAMLGTQFDLSAVLLEQKTISLQQKSVLDKAIVQVTLDRCDEVLIKLCGHQNFLTEQEIKKVQELKNSQVKGIAAVMASQRMLDEEKRQKILATVRHSLLEVETKLLLKVALDNGLLSQFQLEKGSRIYSNNIVTGKYKDICGILLEKDFLLPETAKALTRAVRRHVLTGRAASDYLAEKKIKS